MHRRPPRATKAHGPTDLYLIRKVTRSGGKMIWIDTISREVLDFFAPLGRCVRYGGNYQRLHPETEFKSFIREESSTVGSIYMTGRAAYDPAKTKALPFVVDWEEPERMY